MGIYKSLTETLEEYAKQDLRESAIDLEVGDKVRVIDAEHNGEDIFTIMSIQPDGAMGFSCKETGEEFINYLEDITELISVGTQAEEKFLTRTDDIDEDAILNLLTHIASAAKAAADSLYEYKGTALFKDEFNKNPNYKSLKELVTKLK